MSEEEDDRSYYVIKHNANLLRSNQMNNDSELLLYLLEKL